MEASKTTYEYGIKSTFAQLLAISGLCTVQIGLGVKYMFYLRIVDPVLKDQTWISILYITCTLLGCMQSTLLLGRFGHRKCIILACAEYLTAELAAGLGDRQAWACFGALSEGASVGPCVAYVGEVCDPRLRSTFSAALHALKPISSMTIALMLRLGFFSREESMAVMAAVFPIATVAIMIFVTPDSPMWLLTKGEHAKARETLSGLRGNVSDATCARELKDIVDYTFTTTSRNSSSPYNATYGDSGKGFSDWKQLLRPEVLRPFRRMICNFIVIHLLVKMHSCFWIKYYYEYIIKNEEFEWRDVLFICQPIFGNVTTVLLVNRFGKRLLTLSSISSTSVCLIITGILAKIYNISGEIEDLVIDNFDILITCLFLLMSSVGIESVTNMLITEIFPAKSRYITCNICLAPIFMINFILQINYDNILNVLRTDILKDDQYFSRLNLLLGIFGFFEYMYLYFYQKETENKSLIEIYKLFN